MITITNYIQEKLKITKDTKIISYKYYPKDKDELLKILKDRLSKDSNANLNDIDTSKITDMANLFKDLYVFFDIEIGNINVSYWDVSNVKNMNNMFANCSNFNCDLSNWNVSDKLKYNDITFYKCDSLKNKPIWYK